MILSYFFSSPLFASPLSSFTTTQIAERLFHEKFYGDALPLYSLLFSTTESENLKTDFALRLAICHLEEGNLQTAFDLITPLKSGPHSSACLYLLSCVHKKKGESAQALELLNQCSCFGTYFPSPVLITLEKGFHSFQLGDFQQALSLFSQISWEFSTPSAYYFAQLNLAKIYLLTHQLEKAKEAFSHLELLLPERHPLKKVERYLKGIFFLQTGQSLQATLIFDSLLPADPSQTTHSIPLLEALIISQMESLLSLSPFSNEMSLLVSNGEQRIKQLLNLSFHHSHVLLSADFYLRIGNHLSDKDFYQKGVALLSQHPLTITPEEKIELSLKQAETAPSYRERHFLYQKIIEQSLPSLLEMKARTLQGLNEFEEGMSHQKKKQNTKQILYFEQAMEAFNEVIRLGQTQKETLSFFYQATALKYLALSHVYHSGKNHIEQAWKIARFLLNTPSFLSLLKFPQEIYALAGWIALHLSDQNDLNQAQHFLQKGITLDPHSLWGKNCLKLQGFIYLQLQQWKEAEELFHQLTQEGSPYEAEALFWLAYSAGKQNEPILKERYLKEVYEKHPKNAYAPLAYFHLYSYREYMRGQRKIIKHLQDMPSLFPSHPLLISAYYLMGMDHKKDHLSEKNKLLRGYDWLAAIDAFQKAESTFDELLEKQLIPSLEIPYFSEVKEQCWLERGKLNFEIAQKSTGGKRLIYLEYAENVFKKLIQFFLSSDQPIHYSKRWAEAEFQLAKIYREEGKIQEAEEMLNQALHHFKEADIREGWPLMRIWMEKGKMAYQKEAFKTALDFFNEGEKAMSSKGMDPDETLLLWIKQSRCHQALHQWDQAMRLLAKVINAAVVSPLRIQAMFLRAEMYEQQGRSELAFKQLEAISRQGGKWAEEAQDKINSLPH